MIVRAMFLVVLVTAAGCTPVRRDQVAQDAARSAIGRVVLSRHSGADLQIAIDCITTNAMRSEILSLASNALTGPNAATEQTVSAIAARPETRQCLAAQGLPAF